MKIKLMEALESSNKTLRIFENSADYNLRWPELLELAHRLEAHIFGELQAEHQDVVISLEQAQQGYLVKGIRLLDVLGQRNGFVKEIERYRQGYY